MGMTALHVLCCNPNKMTYAIKSLKDAHPDAATIRNVAGMTPLMMLLKCKSLACDDLYMDGEFVLLGRLLELGLDYDALEMIMGATDVEVKNRLVLALESIDEESGLPTFMQAALQSGCTLIWCIC